MENMMPLLVLAFLFMVVSHPKTYEFTGGLVGSVLPDLELVDEAGQPTMMGQVLHAVVLCLLWWVVNTYVMPMHSLV